MTTANGHAPPSLASEILSRYGSLIVNAMTQPFSRLRQMSDPRRDVEAEVGYPSLGEAVSPSLYAQLYERDAVAARVVEVYPAECWQVSPSVYEDEDSEQPTEFEAAVDALGASLYDEPDCVYRQEEGSPVLQAMKDADVLSGVGRYGVIVLGTDDGRPLSEPLQRAAYPARKLTFLLALPESLAVITQFDTDRKSRRCGRPRMYGVTFGDQGGDQYAYATSAAGSYSEEVHWTRVVHVADTGHQASPSKVFARPRMKAVLNNLLGLHKLYACAPEMYWLAALPLLKFITHADLGGDVDVDVGEIKDAVEQVRNGMQRVLLGRGGDWGSVAPSVVDPAGQIATQLEAICVKLGCPVRVFKGSERGELASSQDDQAWNDRLKQRQHSYISPGIIAPLFSRLIWLGVLPKPKQLRIWWPDLTSVSDGQKADVAAKKTAALAQYVGGNVESIIAPTDYLTRVLDFSEEEAAAILENAQGAVPPPMPDEGLDLGRSSDAAGQEDAYAPEPSVNAWSEAAREAALAARREKMKGKEKPAAKPASAGKGKPADVKVKAAADKVAKINARVTAAKQKLDKLKGELKAAKADLAKVKGDVKAKVADPAVKEKAKADAASLDSQTYKWVAEIGKGGNGPTDAEINTHVDKMLGKSPAAALQTAKAMDLPRAALKSGVKAREAIKASIRERMEGARGRTV